MSQRNTTNVVKSKLNELGGAEQFPMNEQEIALAGQARRDGGGAGGSHCRGRAGDGRAGEGNHLGARLIFG